MTGEFIVVRKNGLCVVLSDKFALRDYIRRAEPDFIKAVYEVARDVNFSRTVEVTLD